MLNQFSQYIESVNKIKSINQIEDLLIDFYPKGSLALFYFRVTADSKDSNLNILKMYPGVLGIERDYYLKKMRIQKRFLENTKSTLKKCLTWLASQRPKACKNLLE